MHRIIPRHVFQTLAMLLLPAPVLLAAYWFLTDSGLYHWFLTLLGQATAANRGVAVLLTLLANLTALAILALILRIFTTGMPTLRDQLQNEIDLLKTPGTFREKIDAALRQEQARRRSDPQAARLGDKVTAMGVLTLGLALTLVGAASWLLAAGDLYQFQIILLLLGLGLTIWGATRLLRL
jgi:hypothetical protein